MKLKRILSIILVVTIICSSTIVFAEKNVSESSIEKLYFFQDDSKNILEEVIKIDNTYVYSKITDDYTISITLHNNVLLDYAYKNKAGEVFYYDTKTPLSQFGKEYLNKNSTLETFKYIANCILDKKMLLNEKQMPKEKIDKFNNSNTMMAASSSVYNVAYFTSEMNARGFTDYSNKVMATRYVHGIPATVKGNGDLLVSQAGYHWILMGTVLSIVTAITGLSAGTLQALGVFIITALGTIEAAMNQDLVIYECQWTGGKWVEFYNQGNYYQASRGVYYRGYGGKAQSMMDPQYDMYDTYYMNDTQLCEAAYLNY